MTRIPYSRLGIAFAGVLAGAAFSFQSSAGPLPAAQFTEVANFDGLPGNGEVIGSGQADVLGSNCYVKQPSGCQSSEAETEAVGPAAVVTGLATGGAGDLAAAGASATVTYNYEVTGTDQPYVPMLVTGSASAAASGQDGSSTGEIFVSYDGTEGYTVEFVRAMVLANGISDPDPAPQTADLYFPFNAVPNFLGSIEVLAECGAEAFPVIKGGIVSDSGQSSCQAGADPIISIAPSFLAANPGVTLEISSNVQQTRTTGGGGAVPEPATLALFGLGLVGVGLSRRRLVC
jgi:hypothetical protein